MTWIQTFSGKAFDVLDVDPMQISIIDIAHALSQICRYTGHTRYPYSVAQHSILMMDAMPGGTDVNTLKWALLHDASEAYLTDIARPVKPHLGNYMTMEKQVMTGVAYRFGLKGAMPEIVKEYDTRILMDERRSLLGPCERDWGIDAEPLNVPIAFMPTTVAKRLFLARYESLWGQY